MQQHHLVKDAHSHRRWSVVAADGSVRAAGLNPEQARLALYRLVHGLDPVDAQPVVSRVDSAHDLPLVA